MVLDILDRLRVDPGQRTLGELLQDREAAFHEIARQREKIKELIAKRTPRSAQSENKIKDTEDSLPFQDGMLMRLSQVCTVLGVSRSTIYKWMNEGSFPAPVRISARSVRWRSVDVKAWRESLVEPPQ